MNFQLNCKLALIVGVSFISLVSSSGEMKTNPAPVITTIHMENGDIFDCIDIKLQPSLQHPLLQNHTIQMRPSFNLTGMPKKSHSEANNLEMSCPDGTIPIWRNQKQNTSIPQSINIFRSLFVKNESYGIQFQTDPTEATAMYGVVGKFTGTKADINVWDPKVYDGPGERYSTAVSSVLSGTESNPEYIAVGWTVWPNIFGDVLSRLYIIWKDGSNKECINHICPGFVQIAKDIFLGAKIEPVSIYLGEQYFVTTQMAKDKQTGDWWLAYQNRYVGYWPKSLFSRLGQGEVLLAWGGAVQSPKDEASPQMGSGNFATEAMAKAAYIGSTFVINEDHRLVYPNMKDLEQFTNKPGCYSVARPPLNGSLVFFFGGPGCNATYKL